MRKTKRIIIISPYPFGVAPSQRFRFEQYLKPLMKKGFEIKQYPFLTEKGWNQLYREGNVVKKILLMIQYWVRRFTLLFRLKKSDAIFIHREMTQFGPPVFEFILSKIMKRKYIYDFDDAIWLPNYSDSNAKFQWVKSYWKVKYCIKWANRVTVGNTYLAEFAKHYNANVSIIPTTIDMNHHNQLVDYDKTPLVIGWTGSHSTIHYLDNILPVLRKLEEEYDFIFAVISDKKPAFDLKSLRYIKWEKKSEINELAKFSIGIMPLKEDKWSKGKCGFKALQYMSMGIPCVISPVGVNNQIVEHEKNGFLASTNEDMYSYLVRLMEDKELRKRIGERVEKQL